MSEPRMRVTVDDDGALARLNFLPPSGIGGELDLTLEQLTLLIQALAAARARMLVGRPAPSLDSVPVQAIVNPPWRVQPEALTEGSMLAFLHPGFGALGFVLGAPDVEKVIRALTTHLAMVRSTETARTKPS